MAITHKTLIRNSAKYFPNKPAVVFEGRSLTFREVDERANRLGNALSGLGLKPGDRVATLMRNSREYVEITFGLIKGGFPQLHMNPRLTWARAKPRFAALRYHFTATAMFSSTPSP